MRIKTEVQMLNPPPLFFPFAKHVTMVSEVMYMGDYTYAQSQTLS
jgi:hypothetical protein